MAHGELPEVAIESVTKAWRHDKKASADTNDRGRSEDLLHEQWPRCTMPHEASWNRRSRRRERCHGSKNTAVQLCTRLVTNQRKYFRCHCSSGLQVGPGRCHRMMPGSVVDDEIVSSGTVSFTCEPGRSGEHRQSLCDQISLDPLPFTPSSTHWLMKPPPSMTAVFSLTLKSSRNTTRP